MEEGAWRVVRAPVKGSAEEEAVDAAPITETPNPATVDLDVATPSRFLGLLRQSDAQIFAGWGAFPGLYDAHTMEAMGRVVDACVHILADVHPTQGAIILAGSGTSGRIAFMVATVFNRVLVAAGYPSRFVYLVSGGDKALLLSDEMPEDDPHQGERELRERVASRSQFVYVGISCGLSAPYVAGQAAWAMEQPGATTVLVGFNPAARARARPVEGWDRTVRDVVLALERSPDKRHILVNPVIGPEPLTGSTRMKGGTATKILLETMLGLALTRALPDVSATSVPDTIPIPPSQLPGADADGVHHHYWALAALLTSYEVVTRSLYLQIPSLSSLVAAAADALGRGRHLYYVGGSVSGVLGLVDASEMVDTFSAPADEIRAFRVGGWAGMDNVEGEGVREASPLCRTDVHDFIAEIVPELTPEDLVIVLVLDGEEPSRVSRAAQLAAARGARVGVLQVTASSSVLDAAVPAGSSSRDGVGVGVGVGVDAAVSQQHHHTAFGHGHEVTASQFSAPFSTVVSSTVPPISLAPETLQPSVPPAPLPIDAVSGDSSGETSGTNSRLLQPAPFSIPVTAVGSEPLVSTAPPLAAFSAAAAASTSQSQLLQPHSHASGAGTAVDVLSQPHVAVASLNAPINATTNTSSSYHSSSGPSLPMTTGLGYTPAPASSLALATSSPNTSSSTSTSTSNSSSIASSDAILHESAAPVSSVAPVQPAASSYPSSTDAVSAAAAALPAVSLGASVGIASSHMSGGPGASFVPAIPFHEPVSRGVAETASYGLSSHDVANAARIAVMDALSGAQPARALAVGAAAADAIHEALDMTGGAMPGSSIATSAVAPMNLSAASISANPNIHPTHILPDPTAHFATSAPVSAPPSSSSSSSALATHNNTNNVSSFLPGGPLRTLAHRAPFVSLSLPQFFLFPGVAAFGELALKLALNAISTAAQAARGRVYRNRMIDVAVANAKLLDRATALVAELAPADPDAAAHALLRSIHSVEVDRPLPDEILNAPPSFHVRAATDRQGVVPVALLLASGAAPTLQAARDAIANTPVLRHAIQNATASKSIPRKGRNQQKTENTPPKGAKAAKSPPQKKSTRTRARPADLEEEKPKSKRPNRGKTKK